MTSERRKSILVLIFTLLVGIFLGLLVPGFYYKLKARDGHGGRAQHQGPERKKDWFAGTIIRIIKPDSAQARQIKPITEWAAIQVDSIEHSANNSMSILLDSVKVKLKPHLTASQMQRLDEFEKKADGNWRNRDRHGKR